MKSNNIIPIVCGCIALIASIGFISEFNNNAANNGLAVAIITTLIPIGGLAGCIYFIVKGSNTNGKGGGYG